MSRYFKEQAKKDSAKAIEICYPPHKRKSWAAKRLGSVVYDRTLKQKGRR